MKIIEGVKELHVVLATLDAKTSRRVVRAALRAGVRTIVTGIRREIPTHPPKPRKRPGKDAWAKPRKGKRRRNIPKAIGQIVGKDRSGQIAAKAGAKVGDASKRIDESNWFVHILAMGSRMRYRGRFGNQHVKGGSRSSTRTKRRGLMGEIYRAHDSVKNLNTGRIIAEDFVRRGYDKSAHAAQAAIGRTAKTSLEREIAKLASGT